jgi:hypothetical protein
MKRLLIGFAFAAVLGWPQKEAPVASEKDRARQKLMKQERPVKVDDLEAPLAREMDFKEHAMYAYIEKLKSIQEAVAKFGRL